MDALLSGGGFDFAAAAGFASSQQNGFLPAHEAERVVESLREFTIEDVGSPAWSSQRQSLERLNVQAHHNAVTNSDEFVKEFLVSHDKVATLVHELLVIEAWKANVFRRVLCTHRSPHDRVRRGARRSLRTLLPGARICPRTPRFQSPTHLDAFQLRF